MRVNTTQLFQLVSIFLVLPSWIGFSAIVGAWVERRFVRSCLVRFQGQQHWDSNSRAIRAWELNKMACSVATYIRFAAYGGAGLAYALAVTNLPTIPAASVIGLGLICAGVWAWQVFFTRRTGNQ